MLRSLRMVISPELIRHGVMHRIRKKFVSFAPRDKGISGWDDAS